MHRSNALNTPTNRSIARPEKEHSVPEAAELLKVSVRYTWYLVARGELASFKRHGRRLVADADLRAYIERLHQAEMRERSAATA